MEKKQTVDLLIRAHVVHTLHDGIAPQAAIAVRAGQIWALSEELHGLDGCIGPQTKVIDQPTGTVLPSLDDTHTHLVLLGLSQFDVPIHQARNIPQMLDMIHQRVSETPEGEWITTTINWQEFNLDERRFPTLQELDAIAPSHPVLVKRGGHSAVANSLALRWAGIDANTKTSGGVIARDKDGNLNGLLQDEPCFKVDAARPMPNDHVRVAQIDAASASFAASGTGCVRDCLASLADLQILKQAHSLDKLHVRARVLISAAGLLSLDEVLSLLDEMEAERDLQTGQWLAVWGLKFLIDGGIEAGATEEPYEREPVGACCPGQYRGAIMWDPDVLVDAMDAVLRRGWRIGTHAYGDRGVHTLLDVYERVMARHPGLPKGTLVIEHGAITDASSRARAIALGIAVTVQHPLLHDVAGVQSSYWGPNRVANMFPVREWIDEGAIVSGGSDYPGGSYAAMRSLWGMASRETVAGPMGSEHAVSVEEALELHTTRATSLLREDTVRGTLAPGRFADLTV